MRVIKATLITMVLAIWGFVAFSPRDEALAGPPLVESTGLTATVVQADIVHTSDALAMPTELAVVGKHLVLADGYADRKIHVLNSEDGAYVRSLGTEGDGPGEYRYPTTITPDREAPGGFWAYDMAAGRLTYVDLDDEESLQRPWETRLVKLEANARVTGAEWTPDGNVVAAGFFPDGRLARFGSDGEMLEAVGSLPDHPAEVPGTVLQHAYMGTMKQHPDGSRIAIGLRHASAIEIRDDNGELVAKTESIQDDFAPKFETQETERGPMMKSGADLRFGYIDVAVTADRIYGLFSGRTREGYPGNANFGSYIHVFDWDGALLKVLEVVESDLSAADLIAIAVDGDTLYGVKHVPVTAVVSVHLADEDVQLASRL